MPGFRDFIQLLEERGEVDHISREVEPRFEMAAIMAKIDQNRRAYRFDNVAGARFPVVGGLYNSLERFGLVLGHDGPEPFSHADFDARIEAAKAGAMEPVVVDTGPCKENKLTGDDIDLAELPVPTFFELDSGPFITGAIGIIRDRDSGELNVGIYRTLIIGKNTCVINASSMSDLRRIYAGWEKSGETMPITIALGVPPTALIGGSVKLPPNVCEYGVAGGLAGAPIELVRCEDSDLLVPADAEIIIEGTVDFSNRIENLLGEFAGQYGPENAPVTQVNTITYRNDAMYYGIVAGRNPEHNTLGTVAIYGVQRSVAASIREVVPEAKDIDVLFEPAMGTLAHVTISIDKQSDDQPGDIIERAFAAGGHIFPVSKITKRIIVVDDDIDVHDRVDVNWAIWNRAAAASKFQVIPDVESWELERAAKDGQVSARIGIDATMDLEDIDKLVRPVIPGAADIRLEDYLDQEA
ncbi:MAG: UbiD family decarboxylase [Gammaproteobacteria bacterium]